MARYSSLNEITKIKQNIVENNIFVYFITKLQRMKGGTSYVGFHGGEGVTKRYTLFIIIPFKIHPSLSCFILQRAMEIGSYR